MIHVIKKQFRTVYSRCPWKQYISKIVIKETVKSVVMWLNTFLPKNGIKIHLSSHVIVIDCKINYKTKYKILFGDYAQVYKTETPWNSTAECTLSIICFGSINNIQNDQSILYIGNWKTDIDFAENCGFDFIGFQNNFAEERGYLNFDNYQDLIYIFQDILSIEIDT